MNNMKKESIRTSDYYYEGEMLKGNPNGLGIKEYQTGDVFIGDFLNEKDSNGLLIVKGEKFFIGELEASTPSKGIFYLSNGSKFIGETKLKGKTLNAVFRVASIGMMIFPSGSKFVGEFTENGGRPMQGTMIYKSGSKFIGTFNNGKPFNGTKIFKNGTRFIGEFDLDGKPKLGILIYPNGKQAHLNPVDD